MVSHGTSPRRPTGLKLRHSLKSRKAKWVIGSPPCTKLLSWQCVNYRDRNDEEIDAHREEGRLHLRFAARLHRRSVRAGRYHIHEHLSGATSWTEPSIRAIRHLPKVSISKCNQCMYGCKSHSTLNDPEPMAAMNPTRFMSNSQAMLSQLSKRCDKTHKHKPLHRNNREEAAYDPLGLINSILKSMNLQAAEDTLKRNEARASRRPVQQLRCAARPQNAKMPISKILGKYKMSRTEGKPAIEIVYDMVRRKQKYVDEYAGVKYQRAW